MTGLAAVGTVSAASRIVGMTARSAYALRKRAGEESEFARAWDEALDRGVADALDIGIKDALQGTEVLVFYGGREVGRYHRHDTRLALATLRAFAARADRKAARSADTSKPVRMPVDPARALHLALAKLASSTCPPISRDD